MSNHENKMTLPYLFAPSLIERSLQDLRRAIKDLPGTLDETYERVLLEIPKDDWKLAQNILALISFLNTPGMESYVFLDDDPRLDWVLAAVRNEGQDLLGNADIQDILGPLIKIDQIKQGDAVYKLSCEIRR